LSAADIRIESIAPREAAGRRDDFLDLGAARLRLQGRDEASPVRDLRVPSRLQFDTGRDERVSRLRRLSTL